jgi:hypothetical protein
MFIKDLVMWRHYNVILENIDITKRPWQGLAIGDNWNLFSAYVIWNILVLNIKGKVNKIAILGYIYVLSGSIVSYNKNYWWSMLMIKHHSRFLYCKILFIRLEPIFVYFQLSQSTSWFKAVIKAWCVSSQQHKYITLFPDILGFISFWYLFL